MSVSLKRLLLVAVLAVLVGFAIAGRWDWLLYGLFLMCPLMHLFGHNNHSGHSGHKH
ncbi:DUF2933 domain-containing protein [Effusibacillus lacus]|nr:DUF2933 domain-containing protein [Effusibacillus lacus]TCS74954.1 DUF2933 family protein [Effusibacillus lacus]